MCDERGLPVDAHNDGFSHRPALAISSAGYMMPLLQ